MQACETVLQSVNLFCMYIFASMSCERIDFFPNAIAYCIAIVSSPRKMAVPLSKWLRVFMWFTVEQHELTSPISLFFVTVKLQIKSAQAQASISHYLPSSLREIKCLCLILRGTGHSWRIAITKVNENEKLTPISDWTQNVTGQRKSDYEEWHKDVIKASGTFQVTRFAS